jgi:signal transduction histidine kinase
MQEVGNRLGGALANAQIFAVAEHERERAEQANAAKDQVLAALSHELKTPLSAILGWVQALRGGRLSPGQRERALEVIERNARVQVNLVDDLLDVSRIVAGKMHLGFEQVDFTHTVDVVLESLRHSAEEKGVRLERGRLPSPLWVEGDGGRLQQIVWNLLSNAIKFTPAGGEIRVTMEALDTVAVLHVRDSGQGIAPELLPRVFEAFFQGPQGAETTRRGLGLGLSIVRDLVEKHGGEISAQSEGPGRGACFNVRLPRLPLEALEPAGASGPERS